MHSRNSILTMTHIKSRGWKGSRESHIRVSVDNQGILAAGFDREYYNVESLALVDTGNDVAIVTQEYLGIQLHGGIRVLFK